MMLDLMVTNTTFLLYIFLIRFSRHPMLDKNFYRISFVCCANIQIQSEVNDISFIASQSQSIASMAEDNKKSETALEITPHNEHSIIFPYILGTELYNDLKYQLTLDFLNRTSMYLNSHDPMQCLDNRTVNETGVNNYSDSQEIYMQPEKENEITANDPNISQIDLTNEIEQFSDNISCANQHKIKQKYRNKEAAHTNSSDIHTTNNSDICKNTPNITASGLLRKRKTCFGNQQKSCNKYIPMVKLLKYDTSIEPNIENKDWYLKKENIINTIIPFIQDKEYISPFRFHYSDVFYGSKEMEIKKVYEQFKEYSEIKSNTKIAELKEKLTCDFSKLTTKYISFFSNEIKLIEKTKIFRKSVEHEVKNGLSNSQKCDFNSLLFDISIIAENYLLYSKKNLWDESINRMYFMTIGFFYFMKPLRSINNQISNEKQIKSFIASHSRMFDTIIIVIQIDNTFTMETNKLIEDITNFLMSYGYDFSSCSIIIRNDTIEMFLNGEFPWIVLKEYLLQQFIPLDNKIKTIDENLNVIESLIGPEIKKPSRCGILKYNLEYIGYCLLCLIVTLFNKEIESPYFLQVILCESSCVDEKEKSNFLKNLLNILRDRIQFLLRRNQIFLLFTTLKIIICKIKLETEKLRDEIASKLYGIGFYKAHIKKIQDKYKYFYIVASFIEYSEQVLFFYANEYVDNNK